ncbi:MAG: hypothetical protein GY793_07805 [Proteobacteria bacterium]|nr:hypothetical protein [Pseudomonadota bacterium]
MSDSNELNKKRSVAEKCRRLAEWIKKYNQNKSLKVAYDNCLGKVIIWYEKLEKMSNDKIDWVSYSGEYELGDSRTIKLLEELWDWFHVDFNGFYRHYV